MTYFVHPVRVWDKKECEKRSKYLRRDGLGTPYPFKGSIGEPIGKTRYNGGCVRNDEWYNGEEYPMPQVHEDYEIIVVPTWGYRIRKKSAQTNPTTRT